MKNIADDLRQREAETEKLRQSLRNTPPNDPAYVCIHDIRIKKILARPFTISNLRLNHVNFTFCRKFINYPFRALLN